MHYDEIILEIREKLNLTQEDLARRLDVSFATVNRWENGKCKPSRMAIKALKHYCTDNKLNIKGFSEGGLKDENK